MRNQPGRLWGVVAGVLATVAVAGFEGVQAQERARPAGKNAVAPAPGTSRKAPRPGGLGARGGVPPKGLRDGAADPLAGRAPNAAPAPAAAPKWPYHLTLRLTGADGLALNAAYYPARGGAEAPVLLLVHQSGTGHSGKDFQTSIEALEGKNLAEHLQDQDYAVLLIDLRGHGPEPRQREVNPRDARSLTGDLHTAYRFLIDRHNRRDLNLSKFGVIAVGDGANLALNWAALDNGAVANPGRPSDLAALVMVSPVAESQGLRLAPAVTALAPRVPMLLIAGDLDEELAKAAQPALERNRQSQVAYFDTRLQGDRLLQFEPKAIEAILRFLDEPVKFRRDALWEPRYLLQPIAINDVKPIARASGPAPAGVPKPAAPKPAEPEAAEPDEQGD